MRALSLLVLCLALPVSAAASTPVPVTTCGQILAGDGFLTGDLDCSAQPAAAATVTLSKTGRLNLGGFTLTGSPNVVDTVRCEDRCIINGLGGSNLGTIAGGQHAIASRSGKSGRVDVFYTTVTGAEFGIVAPKVHARQLHVTGNTFEGIRGDKVKLIDSTVTDNGGLGAGVRGEAQVKLIAAVITGNGGAGVEGGKLHAQDSTVTGNGTDPACGVTAVCADLSLQRKPHLKRTPCDTSLDRLACTCSVGAAPGPGTDPATHNFGVCAND
jgi:hypothetical protein